MGYKEEHEAFVSGLSGSSVWVVLYIGLSIVVINTVRQAADPRGKRRSFVTSLVLDNALINIPLLVLVSYPTTWGIWMNCFFVIIFVLLQFLSFPSKRKFEINNTKLPFLSVYRSSLLLLTCLAILAVDFRIFPRYLAKTETFGYSLMDTGVGSFVFANAIVSKTARTSSSAKKQNSYSQRVLKSLRGVSPLLILGFFRLFSTKAADYQEHISEYGVHWNFFFTLSAVAVFVSVLDLSGSSCAWVSFSLITVYQTALWFGLEDWILNAPRDNLITANKEGICSSIGFLCICLFGTHIGSILFSAKTRSQTHSQQMKQLLIIDAIFWVLCFGLEFFFAPSRRMANITYVMFTVAFNLLLIALFKQLEKLSPPIDSNLIDGLGRNGLIMFLIANLLTGATNLSMQTIYASDLLAGSILLAYLFALSVIASTLHVKQITLKFW